MRFQLEKLLACESKIVRECRLLILAAFQGLIQPCAQPGDGRELWPHESCVERPMSEASLVAAVDGQGIDESQQGHVLAHVAKLAGDLVTECAGGRVRDDVVRSFGLALADGADVERHPAL